MSRGGSPPQSRTHSHPTHQPAPQNTLHAHPPYPSQPQINFYTGQPILCPPPVVGTPSLNLKAAKALLRICYHKGTTMGAHGSPEWSLHEAIVKLARSLISPASCYVSRRMINRFFGPITLCLYVLTALVPYLSRPRSSAPLL